MAYKKYTVTVRSVDGGNRFFLDGVQTPVLHLQEGVIYEFDTSHGSVDGHTFKFSKNIDGTQADSGTEYTTNVTETGTPGTSGAKTTIRIVGNEDTLYYFCGNHSGMGGVALTPSSTINKAPVFVENYRTEYTELKQGDLNEAVKVLTPGVNGSRIHQMVLTSDDSSNEITVDFGFIDVISA